MEDPVLYIKLRHSKKICLVLLLVVNVFLLFRVLHYIIQDTFFTKLNQNSGWKIILLYQELATLLEFITENDPVLLDVTFRFILFTIER